MGTTTIAFIAGVCVGVWIGLIIAVAVDAVWNSPARRYKRISAAMAKELEG